MSGGALPHLVQSTPRHATGLIAGSQKAPLQQLDATRKLSQAKEAAGHVAAGRS
jgi:hypothetical protein